MSDPLPTGATIGILGGGQLGRMMSLAAARLGLRCHIFDPSPDSPALQVSAASTIATYDDDAALRAFAGQCSVVTYEFENIPTSALDLIEELVPIRPGRKALATSQDRLHEKDFLNALGLETAPYRNVESAGDMANALAEVGVPSILKTRRFGYDGKGQARLTSADQAEDAVASMGGAPSVLEGMIAFEREISVIAARGPDGACVAYDPGENVHKDGILRSTTVPANISEDTRARAVRIATTILDALEYVGVIGVELFELDGNLIVNEFAPRVHNSGHWTQNGCAICQFEQHIRAVAGWPLGNGSRHSDVEMQNLIGDDVEQVGMLAGTSAALHLYGKSDVRPGRKMGHVNRLLGPGR